MLGSNLVPFDQIKLQNVETGIYTNDPLAAVVRHTGTPWVSISSLVLLSPAPQSCLCHLMFFVC